MNCRRPTLIQNGSQISGATLKNSATLISSAPCRDLVDAYLRRRQFGKRSNLIKFGWLLWKYASKVCPGCCAKVCPESMPRLTSGQPRRILSRVGSHWDSSARFVNNDFVASIGTRYLKTFLWPMLKNYRSLLFFERRCLKTLRRLFHPLPAEIWSMLKNSATLIASATCQDVVDA